jgi:2-dehydro-3-deoxygluconokinase
VILAVGEGLYELGLDDDGGPPREGFGGDAANTAVMAGLMNVPARIAGRVGDDAVGRRLLAFWESRGVATEDVITDRFRPTGIYVNRRGADGVHHFDYHRAGSAGSAIEPADVANVRTDDVVFTHFTGVGLSVSSPSAQACAALVRRTRATGGRISFSANVRPRLGPKLDVLRQGAAAADVVFVSAEDAALLYGQVETAVAELVRTAEEVIVTAGDQGATLYASGETVTVSPPALDVVDAAGAGDALAGAYLAARAVGLDKATALSQGVIAGALSCRAFGCAASYPTHADVVVGASNPGGVSR